MKLPYLREQSDQQTRHHLLFERLQWSAPRPNRVRMMGGYVVGCIRSHHDYIHENIQPVPVPGLRVLDTMYEIGRESIGLQNDQNRMKHILDGLVGYAMSTGSAQECHDMLRVATSIEAQMSILGLMRGIKPKYE